MPLTDTELWSVASTILRRHGEDAPLFVAERIGALALLEDWDGVSAWKGIAARMDMLRHGTPQ